MWVHTSSTTRTCPSFWKHLYLPVAALQVSELSHYRSVLPVRLWLCNCTWISNSSSFFPVLYAFVKSHFRHVPSLSEEKLRAFPINPPLRQLLADLPSHWVLVTIPEDPTWKSSSARFPPSFHKRISLDPFLFLPTGTVTEVRAAGGSS